MGTGKVSTAPKQSKRLAASNTEATMKHTRTATEDDARYIASRLRAADLREIDAASGKHPLEVALVGFRHSPVCRVVTRDDDKPIALYGVIPWPCGTSGFPWLIATDEVTTSQRMRFLRTIKPDSRSVEIFATMRGYVHADNTAHIEWIRWLGYSLSPTPEPHGHRGEPFIQFWKDCHV